MGDLMMGLGPIEDLRMRLGPMEDLMVGLGPTEDLRMGLSPVGDLTVGLGPTEDLRMGLGPLEDLTVGLSPTKDLRMGLGPVGDLMVGLGPTEDQRKGLDPMGDLTMGLGPTEDQRMGLGLVKNQSGDHCSICRDAPVACDCRCRAVVLWTKWIPISKASWIPIGHVWAYQDFPDDALAALSVVRRACRLWTLLVKKGGCDLEKAWEARCPILKGYMSSRLLCSPEFHLVRARMREAYATRLGSIHLPVGTHDGRARNEDDHHRIYNMEIETPKVDGIGRMDETRARMGRPFSSIDRGVSDSLMPRILVNHGITVMPLSGRTCVVHI
ncbi:hypothetical protein CRG98_021174 [Punica granatum]|uniref:Uncharacterized protein n=1 Tax=Punica granatum TaxID=22663 RepID=A0A2I0JSG7_PUNGR|nr:hypothetical protein CRG98_021174 [Punica granatum]